MRIHRRSFSVGTSALIGGFLALCAPLITASPQGDPVPPEPICDDWLFNQNSIAECLGSWIRCDQDRCCDHWHLAMNWHTCQTSGGAGNMECDTSSKKYYQYRDEYCGPTACVRPAAQTDSGDHYEDDWSLRDCN